LLSFFIIEIDLQEGLAHRRRSAASVLYTNNEFYLQLNNGKPGIVCVAFVRVGMLPQIQRFLTTAGLRSDRVPPGGPTSDRETGALSVFLPIYGGEGVGAGAGDDHCEHFPDGPVFAAGSRL
jgi:hypothetical protein